MVNLWKNGVNDDGVIINCKAPNPKFELIPIEGLERIRKQADLVILKRVKEYETIERAVKSCIQEPENSVNCNEINVDFISNVINNNNNNLFDEGCRFEEPYIVNLSTTARNIRFESKNIIETVGQGIQAQNLDDGLRQVASFVFKNGSGIIDERNIVTIESRSISITIIDALKKIPQGFSKEFITKYVKEFMKGVGESLEDFAYTYHYRIFKKWGNQVERVIEILQKNPNTRRALISLWDPVKDLGNPSPPCLDFIWLVIRNNELELHVTYRSHHLATITEEGKLMEGEGAFVPNLYALATLQEYIANKVEVKRGPLILTDFSGHVYVNKV